MESVIHLDTHVIAWLYAGDVDRLEPARERLERSALVVSPMAVLELEYLFEVGKTTEPGSTVLADLVKRTGLRVSTAGFLSVAIQALAEPWTRDPFDRMIVANAIVENAPLLTCDRVIQAHYGRAVWP